MLKVRTIIFHSYIGTSDTENNVSKVQTDIPQQKEDEQQGKQFHEESSGKILDLDDKVTKIGMQTEIK